MIRNVFIVYSSLQNRVSLLSGQIILLERVVEDSCPLAITFMKNLKNMLYKTLFKDDVFNMVWFQLCKKISGRSDKAHAKDFCE